MVDPVFDVRAKHAGEPGVHALIIGISNYSNLPAANEERTKQQEQYGLGLSRLTSAATTGFLIYQWLLESRDKLPVPLTTCRLLLAPVDAELESVEGLGAVASDASLDAVLAAATGWQCDVGAHQGGLSFFYFAGHGLQRKRGDHVLVLQDVGQSFGARLQKAIDSFSLVQGMAPSKEYPEIARRQLYFFDACRMRPAQAFKYEDERCTAVFNVPTIERDDRAAPEYYTALPGTSAFALPGEQTVFSKALLQCLRGGIGEKRERRWCVTLHSLNKGLQHNLAKILEKKPEEQMFRLDGLTENLLVCWLAEPPEVELEVEIVPESAAADAKLTLSDLKNPARTFGPPLNPHPYVTHVKAGSYQVTLQVATPEGGSLPPELLEAHAPRDRWELALQGLPLACVRPKGLRA